MPYLDAPPWAKTLDRTILTVQYIAILCMGLLATVLTGDSRLILMGWVVTVTAVLCGAGSATGRWEVESVGLLPLAGALASVLVILGPEPFSIVWWTVLALVAAVLRQWLRLLLQVLLHLRLRKRLEALET